MLDTAVVRVMCDGGCGRFAEVPLHETSNGWTSRGLEEFLAKMGWTVDADGHHCRKCAAARKAAEKEGGG